MANYLDLPFGVRVSGSDPIDADRYIAIDAVQRDLLVTNGRATSGQQCYQLDTRELFILRGDTVSDWTLVGSGSGGGGGDVYLSEENIFLKKNTFQLGADINGEDLNVSKSINTGVDTATGNSMIKFNFGHPTNPDDKNIFYDNTTQTFKVQLAGGSSNIFDLLHSGMVNIGDYLNKTSVDDNIVKGTIRLEKGTSSLFVAKTIGGTGLAGLNLEDSQGVARGSFQTDTGSGNVEIARRSASDILEGKIGLRADGNVYSEKGDGTAPIPLNEKDFVNLKYLNENAPSDLRTEVNTWLETNTFDKEVQMQKGLVFFGSAGVEIAGSDVSYKAGATNGAAFFIRDVSLLEFNASITAVEYNKTSTNIDDTPSGKSLVNKDWVLSKLGAVAATRLIDMEDVPNTYGTDGHVLVARPNAAGLIKTEWVSQNAATNMNLTDLLDVTITAPKASNSLIYNSAVGRWENLTSRDYLKDVEGEYNVDDIGTDPGVGVISRVLDVNYNGYVYINKVDANGLDLTNFLVVMKEHDWFNITNYANTAVYENYDISGEITSTADVFKIPVVLHSRKGGDLNGFLVDFKGNFIQAKGYLPLSGGESEPLTGALYGGKAYEDSGKSKGNYLYEKAIKIQTHVWQNSAWVAVAGIGFGLNAMSGNSAAEVVAMGKSAASGNVGRSLTAIGNSAGYQNASLDAIAIGAFSLYFGNSNNAVAIGNYAMQYAGGQNVVAVGDSAGKYNNGRNVAGVGRDAARENIGNDLVSIGKDSGFRNTGESSTALGTGSLHENEGDNNTAVGHNSFSNPKIVIGSVNILSYDNATRIFQTEDMGLVSNKKYLLIIRGADVPSGLIDGTAYLFNVITSTTVEILNVTVNDIGSGAMTFDKLESFENSTALGYNAQPTQSNQVVLGNNLVTSVRVGNPNYTPINDSDLVTKKYHDDNLAPGAPTSVFSWDVNYVPGKIVAKQTMVKDGIWAMISNADNNGEPAAPVALHVPIWDYTEVPLINTSSAKQVVTGVRITAEELTEVRSVRFNTKVDYEYGIYTVKDPLGANIVSFIGSKKALVDELFSIPINPITLTTGAVLDIVVIITKEGNHGTDVVLSYDYLKPTNPATLLAGQIEHSNKELGTLKVHMIDNDSVDNTATLSLLDVGDSISVGGTEWNIQTAEGKTGDVFTFVVSPELQDSSSGVQDFTFTLVSISQIDNDQDVDFYLGTASRQGILSVDSDLGNAVISEDFQGVDFEFVEFSVSSKWDYFLRDTNSSSVGSSGEDTSVSFRNYSEGNGIGYGTFDREENFPASRGVLGFRAVDFSYVYDESITNQGATGESSVAFGLDNISSAWGSLTTGYLNKAGGYLSTAIGTENRVGEDTTYAYGATAIGIANIVESNFSVSLGSRNEILTSESKARTSQVTIGSFLVSSTDKHVAVGHANLAPDDTGYRADASFTVGVGDSVQSGTASSWYTKVRANGLEVTRNVIDQGGGTYIVEARVTAPSTTNAVIDSEFDSSKILVTKDWVTSNFASGAGFLKTDGSNNMTGSLNLNNGTIRRGVNSIILTDSVTEFSKTIQPSEPASIDLGTNAKPFGKLIGQVTEVRNADTAQYPAVLKLLTVNTGGTEMSSELISGGFAPIKQKGSYFTFEASNDILFQAQQGVVIDAALNGNSNSLTVLGESQFEDILIYKKQPSLNIQGTDGRRSSVYLKNSFGDNVSLSLAANSLNDTATMLFAVNDQALSKTTQLTMSEGIVHVYSNGGIATPMVAEDLTNKAYVDSVAATRVSQVSVPSSATSQGKKGDMRHEGDYIYICVDTDTWKRVELKTW